MRAVRYHEFGGTKKLQIEQIPQPEPDGENVLTVWPGVSRSSNIAKLTELP